LTPPPAEKHVATFDGIVSELAVDADNLVRLPQVDIDGFMVDTVDRIRVGADIVRRFAAAGL
jgi:hypothetical protein